MWLYGRIKGFRALIDINCSPHLTKLLCATYIPMCIQDWAYKVFPCHSLCTSVKDSCYKYMLDRGIFWPSDLDCDKFPEN
ncbi:Frizzled-8, partial [Cichlidogyrus casuarinus]